MTRPSPDGKPGPAARLPSRGASPSRLDAASGDAAYNVGRCHPPSAPVGPVPSPGVFRFRLERGHLDMASFGPVRRVSRMVQRLGARTYSLVAKLNEVLAA